MKDVLRKGQVREEARIHSEDSVSKKAKTRRAWWLVSK